MRFISKVEASEFAGKYDSAANFVAELSRLTLIIGKSSTGKSTLLRHLKALGSVLKNGHAWQEEYADQGGVVRLTVSGEGTESCADRCYTVPGNAQEADGEDRRLLESLTWLDAGSLFTGPKGVEGLRHRSSPDNPEYRSELSVAFRSATDREVTSDDFLAPYNPFLSVGERSFLYYAGSLLCALEDGLSVVAADCPERKLHPQMLPVLAGLYQVAASQAQVIVVTHSPYFLSQFELKDIAVMRRVTKTQREVIEWARPIKSRALRELIEDGGPEVLSRLFLSGELEGLAD